MDFLKGLNAQQREAVSHTEGPLLILAGAGSGKTRVITHRIAHIITSRHVPPSAILAVTFTNKAADEMRERVSALLEDVRLDSAPNVTTFHSFCVRLLRRDGDPLGRIRPGFTRRFSIYDDDDQLGIVKSVYRALGLDEKEFMQYRAALSRISHAKNRKQTPQDIYKAGRQSRNREAGGGLRGIRKGAAHYQRAGFRRPAAGGRAPAAARRGHARSLEPAPELRDGGRIPGHQPQPVRVDAPAFGVAPQCVRGGRRRPVDLQLARSGHPQHSRFRARFPQRADHPAGAELPVDQEHPGGGRRGGREQQGAQRQKAVDRGGSRRAARTVRRLRRRERSAVHCRHIEKHLASNPGDHVAVLYRTNFQSRQIEEALRRYGRKYNVVGGFSFYQRAEVKDTVAYLQAGGIQYRFGEPAADHQHAGARYRPHHGGADRASRARARPEPVGGHRTHHRRPGALHPFPVLAGDVPQPDPGAVAGGQFLPAAGPAALHAGAHRLPPHVGAGEDAGLGNAPGKPGRVDQRGCRSRTSAARASRIFWTTPRWWRRPTRSTSAPRSR